MLKTTKRLPFEVWGGITRSGYALEFKRLSSAYAELGKLYRDHERGRTIPIGGQARRRSTHVRRWNADISGLGILWRYFVTGPYRNCIHYPDGLFGCEIRYRRRRLGYYPSHKVTVRSVKVHVVVWKNVCAYIHVPSCQCGNAVAVPLLGAGLKTGVWS